MKLTRIKTAKQLGPLVQHLTLCDPASSKERFIQNLEELMEHAPENLLILAHFDEDTNLTSFIIAQNPGPKAPYIFLAQVWSRADNEPDWYESFYARLLLWAIALDKSYIRGETERNTEAMYRRFGFKPYFQVIRLDLDHFNDLLMDNPKEFFQWATSESQA